MIEKLEEINRLRDEGEISSREADIRKYNLIMDKEGDITSSINLCGRGIKIDASDIRLGEIDEEEHEREDAFDSSCTT